MLDIANSMDPPPYSERELDTSPLGHSGYNFASTAPSDMRANIQTSGDQSCQNHLSESQHSRHKRNSMLQKVVRGVSRGKGADARPMSFHADTATTQRLHGMVLLRTERQRPQSFLSNPHTRQPTGSRMSFELNSPSIRHTLRHD
ncbi:hypothetical protein DFH28DRAFT_138100 [Melampsora americana]|nr:hypothetical protein DFH28DRAFT_138100 [Melampsora americana]